MQNPRQTNTFGIAGITLGVVGAAGCWLPFVNLVSLCLAVVGFALSIAGLVVDASEKRASASASIAGFMLCVVVFVLSLV